jgi:cysteinyl-tRNA synthetase
MPGYKQSKRTVKIIKMIQLYNTMSRTIDVFEPQNNNEVSIYSCGPTVYDYPHIGNWYSFIRWDILNRILIASGYKTKWIMNITDVGHLTSDGDEGEDKLEKGAKREHKTAWEIADEYSKYFLDSLEKLNFSKPAMLPKATDNIDCQLELIKKLEDQDLIYIIEEDGVYFDTSKLPDYGKLARLNVSDLKAGSRIGVNENKKNISDFAIWKFSPKDKKRDMEWDSPWGKGFPGWHLECSALVKQYLGDTIDVHCGGIDHIPVHHTNEIAQSESANHETLANYWLHSNFVKVDDQKISKSLQNGITLEDIEVKGFSLEAFRLLVLESHYRSEAHFSWDILTAAQNRLDNFKLVASLAWQAKDLPSNGNSFYDTKEVLAAFQNDLNSPEALSIVSEKFDILSDKLLPKSDEGYLRQMLIEIEELFGLRLSCRDITETQKQLIQDREIARNTKDWPRSDAIRDQLKEQGIELRDTSYGPIWNRC